jgi:hypothetical protein
MYYNIVRIHRTLHVTPAIAAGVVDRLWKIPDIAKLVEDAEGRAQGLRPLQETHRLVERRMAAPTVPPLVIVNSTDAVMEISVEIYPDRYLLKPGEEMTIEADPSGVPFTIQPFEGGLQVYPGNTAGAAVTINGKPVQPDWDTPV